MPIPELNLEKLKDRYKLYEDVKNKNASKFQRKNASKNKKSKNLDEFIDFFEI